jgi:thioredoxin
MPTRDLTEADFESVIADNDIVLIDFWAAWCGPCRQFAPVFAAASEQHPDIVFAKIDTEAEQLLAGAAQVASIPTLMAFREGVLVYSQPGALPATALEQVIAAVKGLDMTDVHAQVAAQRALLDKPREITLEEFATAQAEGVAVIDVREPMEYRVGHVPGAVLVPLGRLPQPKPASYRLPACTRYRGLLGGRGHQRLALLRSRSRERADAYGNR